MQGNHQHVQVASHCQTKHAAPCCIRGQKPVEDLRERERVSQPGASDSQPGASDSQPGASDSQPGA
eukprot:18360-Pyramimonas_sp.AAC.1